MNKQNYYVYAHKLLDGTVFYIGRGRGDRAKTTKGRNVAWNALTSCNEYAVEYLAENLSLEDAEDFEHELINSPKPEWKLVNVMKDTRALKLLDVVHNVYYDPTSLTFLRWSFDTVRGKRHRDGEAGSINRGYASVMINRKGYLAHRLIWVLFNKAEIPRGYVINHIDCNPSNNSIENLELVTYHENNQRKMCHIGGLCAHNVSGINRVFESKTKPNGIDYFYNATVAWHEDSKQRTKSFGYLKYGKEEAWRLAIEFNNKLLSEGK